MSRELRVGLIGAGMVSAHHLEAWSKTDHARVVGIADPDQSKARQSAISYSIPNVYADARSMLERERLDAVDIVSPVGTHAMLCLLAAEHHLAIMCQKPLCNSAAEAADLVDSIADKVRFKVHENWRFRPEFRRIKALLRTDRLGGIQSVTLDCSSSGLLQRADGSYPALIRQPFFAKLPRLLVFELLIHHLDLITWLFGPVQIGRVTLHRQCPAVLGEDTADIELVTAERVTIRLTGSFCRPAKPEIPTDELTIVGRNGSLRFAAGVLEHWPSDVAPEAFPFERSYSASYAGAIADFTLGLLDHRPFETEAPEHLAILRLVEGIYSWTEYTTP